MSGLFPPLLTNFPRLCTSCVTYPVDGICYCVGIGVGRGQIGFALGVYDAHGLREGHRAAPEIITLIACVSRGRRHRGRPRGLVTPGPRVTSATHRLQHDYAHGLLRDDVRRGPQERDGRDLWHVLVADDGRGVPQEDQRLGLSSPSPSPSLDWRENSSRALWIKPSS